MLTTISTKMLRESLKAIRDLKRKYEGKKQISKYAGCTNEYVAAVLKCSLCIFNTKNHPTSSGSCFCPWIWIEHFDCTTPFMRYNDQTIPERIKRCNRWILDINNEIRRRSE